MAENPQPAAPDAKAASPTIIVKRSLPFSTLLLVVLTALAGGGGIAWFFSQSRVSGDGSVRASSAPGLIVHLEGFTVNLGDTEENDFVRVTMDLELDRLPTPLEKDKPASGLPMARIRDTIIAVLAASKAQALLTPDGKLQLKKTMREELNRRVPEMTVRDIYFTEFLVQR